MTKPTTVTIARFQTYDGAEEAAELLRVNHIKCAFTTPPPDLTGLLSFVGSANLGYPLIVAVEDHERAKEALRGILDAKWFLCSPDGHHEHAFETATPATLRAHADALDPDTPGWERTDCDRLADLIEHAGKTQVFDLFHHGVLHHHGTLVEGRTLPEWATACGALART